MVITTEAAFQDAGLVPFFIITGLYPEDIHYLRKVKNKAKVFD